MSIQQNYLIKNIEFIILHKLNVLANNDYEEINYHDLKEINIFQKKSDNDLFPLITSAVYSLLAKGLIKNLRSKPHTNYDCKTYELILNSSGKKLISLCYNDQLLLNKFDLNKFNPKLHQDSFIVFINGVDNSYIPDIMNRY